MESSFWKERWAQRQIGFHLPEPHRYLRCFGVKLTEAKAARTLVPLCGKSPDLLWLAQNGAQVVGAELVQTAVDEFFDEADQQPQRVDLGTHQRVFSPEMGVEVFIGDFLELRAEKLAPITSVYDRAALVALPPEMRKRYAEHVQSLLPEGGRLLLVTMVYDQSQMTGPPFSVEDGEVRSLFAECQSVNQLRSESIIETEPRFRERGLSTLMENAYLIVR